jgi:hypothetical protein
LMANRVNSLPIRNTDNITKEKGEWYYDKLENKN